MLHVEIDSHLRGNDENHYLNGSAAISFTLFLSRWLYPRPQDLEVHHDILEIRGMSMKHRFGLSWFLGSVLMGVLYDTFILALVIFSSAIQLLAFPFLGIVMKKLK
ncbi:hypothetical protein [Legionella sp. WA2022007384]